MKFGTSRYKYLLSDEDAKKLLDLFISKTNHPKCELCGSVDWGVNQTLHVYSVAVLHSEGVGKAEDRIGPVSAAAICQNCGNTKLLAISALGFEPSETSIVQADELP